MNHIAEVNPSYLRKKWTSPFRTLPCWEIDASMSFVFRGKPKIFYQKKGTRQSHAAVIRST